MATSKRQMTLEEQRQESIYQAERNPRYVFHDAVIIVTLLAVYGMFLAMGRRDHDNEGDT
ncbi:hypothetical protein LLE49_14635 [Alicyclobacillus tolerans]|uniref:hypothetical protein n=1 Tax=Alicyclobacillus tolerans TaxID=90970 RepID=UPI001F3BBA1A|nr:hypothetical protein [Alicyclobacillus tolerans]MCF8565959.1 hypothetical protein [Alicyclobacillus tolerans]